MDKLTLRAGAAEVVITPPVGTRMEGYSARVGGSVGVHDDLHARALAVDDGTTQAAIVACDLIGVDRRLSAAVRQQATAATGIPAEHIMVSATHTHAGPPIIGGGEPALTATLAERIAGAVTAAHHAMRPAALKAGRGSVDSVSQNRRDPAWPFDDELRVLLFDSPDRDQPPIASVVNFACHPTVLYHDTMEHSADYPGATVRTVKSILGDAPVLFLNGACGNVNPAWIEQDFREVDRVGSIVGAEAARRLQELRPLGHQQKVWTIRWDELSDKPVTSGALIPPRLRVASRTVDVALRQLDPPESYDALLAELDQELRDVPPGDDGARRQIMAKVTRYRSEREVARQLRPGTSFHLHPEVQAISFGEGCAVLGLPGEFFVETGRQVRAAADLDHLLIACYTNHHVHYVVPPEAFEQGGYEPGVSLLDEKAEETFRNTAVELLREVST